MNRAQAVRDAFRFQGHSCDHLGSPFMARLMPLLSERLRPGDRVSEQILDWPGDPATRADSLPLRLAGGLHALVIAGQDAGLAAAYPPSPVDDDALWQAVEAAFRRHSDHLLDWLTRPPQTNEVRRAAAVIPALHMVAAATGGLPMALWEVGCSGGLNLRCDRFHLTAGATEYGPEDAAKRLATDWDGPAPAPQRIEVIERRGVDLAPLDPADPGDRLRLRAYLWPDQPHRRALTDAAIAEALRTPAQIDRGDAVDWLAARLPDRPEGATTVICHTVAWQYLPPEARAAGDALIARAGATATTERPLARIAMEADGGKGAGLTLRLWPDGTCHELARVDFHGRSLNWTGPATL